VQSYYTFIALDIARQRAHEADQERLVRDARALEGGPERSIRHSAAVLVAAVSRASGRIARKLDENVAVAVH
jgi:hypothetical protein